MRRPEPLRAPAAALVVRWSLAAAYATSRRALAASRGRRAARAPARLSETGLYAAGRPGVVDARNRPFSPQYPLWTDGATKRRWVLPAARHDDRRAPTTDAWEFPVGTRFWKEFAFGGRKVETRMLWKATSDALDRREPTSGTRSRRTRCWRPRRACAGVVEVAPGRRHSIPARADCVACHGSPARPLGFDALQLSTDRDPNAIHGEPLAPGMLTLATLVDEGRLAPPRHGPRRLVRRASAPRARARARRSATSRRTAGRATTAAARSPRTCRRSRYADVMADGDAVARSLVGRATRWQVPGAPDGASVVLDPAAPDQSALLARMRSRRPSSQMPPLGTVVRDQQAVDAVAEWIATDLARGAGD